jgi:hypothetical protein
MGEPEQGRKDDEEAREEQQPDLTGFWYWKSNEDPWLSNEREKWTAYTHEHQIQIE